MPPETPSPNHTCNAHSGLDGRQTLLIWILGILCTIGAAQMAVLTSIRSDVSVVQTQLVELDRIYASKEDVMALKYDVAAIKHTLDSSRATLMPAPTTLRSR